MAKRGGVLARWPTHRPAHLIVSEMIIVCPHCGSVRQKVESCCVCQGAGKVTGAVALEACQNVWARPGCECHACAVITKESMPPKRIATAPPSGIPCTRYTRNNPGCRCDRCYARRQQENMRRAAS